ncbi:MAG TPA: efflux transporter outer membrane subunit, partial [Povalibacter sp.]|nr:efflux transporter outer membrane subunit [Povalibacter sp.]
FALPVALTFLLAGCVTPQVEEPVGTPVDPQNLGLTGRTVASAANDWWKVFGDPQLDSLIEDATRNSPTLAQAMARVRTAQAQSQAAGAANQPRFSVNADESWQRFSANYYIPPPFGGDTFWIGEAMANLNWDLDFWGRQADLIRQSRSQLTASSLDVAAAHQALANSIVQTYVDLYRAWEMIDIADRLLEQREHLLKLTQQRVTAGLDTQMELRTAEAAIPQARSARLQAESARDLAIHRLAALAGDGAKRYAQMVRPQLSLDAALPLPDQLPIDLLARRPDVLAARARIDAAGAGREAAHAAFYPDISLKAFVGTQAIGLENLVKGDSLVYGVGPALHLPIFDAQRLRAAYKGATAELDASVASYNATVLNAVRETADQISLNDSLTRQIDQAQQTLQAATAAYDLANKRYAAGLSTQLVVLDAETRVLDAQRALVNVNAGRVATRINLLTMLGGSFDPAAPAASGVL